MDNFPLTLSPSDDNARFYDREEEIRIIFNTLKNNKSVCIIGEPGSGKTSLLNYIRRSASDILGSNMTVLMIDLRVYNQKNQFLSYLIDRLNLKKGGDIDQIASQIVNRRILLLIDDFDTISQNRNLSEEIATILLYLNHTASTKVVITSNELTVKARVTEALFDNTFFMINLKPFDTNVSFQILRDYAKETGTSLDDNIIKKAINITKGNPRK